MINKRILLVITLFSLNNIECIYSMDENDFLWKRPTGISLKLQDTDDTKQNNINSDNSSENKINLSTSNSSLENNSIGKEQLRTAANLITVKDIKLLEQNISNSFYRFNYNYLNVEDEDISCDAGSMRRNINYLKELVKTMQQYPSRHNIMRCYMKIKEIISTYVSHKKNGTLYYSNSFFFTYVDNERLDLFHTNERKCDVISDNIKKFILYFENNIFSQIFEIEINTDICKKYFDTLQTNATNNYYKFQCELWMPHILNLSDTINKDILNLKGYINKLTTVFKRFVSKNKAFFVKQGILEFLNLLNEAINKKQYSEIIQLDIASIYKMLHDVMNNNSQYKMIWNTINDMYNALHDIIFNFYSFTNYLYELIRPFQKLNDAKLNEVIKKIELAN